MLRHKSMFCKEIVDVCMFTVYSQFCKNPFSDHICGKIARNLTTCSFVTIMVYSCILSVSS